VNDADLQLRPVQPEDTPFLLRVYASARAAEMAMVPWTGEQKESFLRAQFEAQTREYTARHPHAEHSILVYRRRDVGRCFVSRAGAQVHILDLTVLTPERNAGAGSALIRRLQEEAAVAGAPLTIYVETFNPALAFFTKRGFRPQQQEGIHLLLKWMPGVPLAATGG
jgi:GNAT superfamily N-acetyltransferase